MQGKSLTSGASSTHRTSAVGTGIAVTITLELSHINQNSCKWSGSEKN